MSAGNTTRVKGICPRLRDPPRRWHVSLLCLFLIGCMQFLAQFKSMHTVFRQVIADSSSFASVAVNTSNWDRNHESEVSIEETITEERKEFLSKLRWVARAADNEGNLGFQHDATRVRRLAENGNITFRPLSFGHVCAPPGKGPEGPGGYEVITEKLTVAPVPKNNSIRVFCAFYSYEGNRDLVQSVIETWGKRCDGLLVGSDHTDPDIGAVKLVHSKGGYGDLWNMVQAMLANIYLNYIDDYDVFYIGGDDMFVIVENLKFFFAEIEAKHGKDHPVYTGGWWPIHPRQAARFNLPNRSLFAYMGGGPGYALSRSVVKILVEQELLSCLENSTLTAEDLFMGYCLKTLGITGMNAQDADGGDRFFAFDPSFAYTFRRRGGKQRMSQIWMDSIRRLRPYKLHFHVGMKSVSSTAIGFHLMKTPAKMRRFEKLLYRKNEPDCTCDGRDEPGHRRDFENLVGHNCSWVEDTGVYGRSCFSYNELENVRPPRCNGPEEDIAKIPYASIK